MPGMWIYTFVRRTSNWGDPFNGGTNSLLASPWGKTKLSCFTIEFSVKMAHRCTFLPVDEKYGLWFLTVSSDRTALMNMRSWTLFRRFRLCKIITFQSARYGYLVLLLEHASISVMLTHTAGERLRRAFRWDIPVVFVGSQVSINAVRHNY
jgi:hypothetical protein